MNTIKGFGFQFDIKTGVSRGWFVGQDGIKRWADDSSPCDPNCDRSECGDFSPGECDHPGCPARMSLSASNGGES